VLLLQELEQKKLVEVKAKQIAAYKVRKMRQLQTEMRY